MKTGDRITSLSVANFKSIGRKPQGISIKPLTILAGANSSGKSTLIQPLLLVKQTLEQRGEPEGPLYIEGPNIQFTKAEQFMSRVTGATPDAISFGFGIGHTRFGVEFEYGEQSRLLVVSNTFEVREAGSKTIRSDAASTVDRRLFFLYPRSPGDQVGWWSEVRLGERLSDLSQRVVHVPGIRDTQGRNFSTRGVGPLFRGTFPQYTASVIQNWQQTGDAHRLEVLHRWLRMLDLTGSIEAKRLDDVSIEIRVGRLPGSPQKAKPDMVSIADVGFGVSQVLPALVALLAADDTSLVYIEQPELHLHPNSQVHLASVLAEAAQRGPSVVIETHSSLLIQEIQTLIAKGTLDHDRVALHWCSRDPKTGATKVATADLDKNGSYGDWPIDFDSVALESQSRYLDAVNRGLKH